MKQRITIIVTVIAALALVFSACGTEYIDTSVPDAELLSLRIGDLLQTKIPAAIDDRAWDDEDFALYSAGFEQLSFRLFEDFQEAYFTPQTSPGAKVKWGIANRTTRPNKFDDIRVPANIIEGDFIYFQVISSDNLITRYYRFSTYLRSPVKELSTIELNGIEGNVSELKPDSTWDGDNIAASILYINQDNPTTAKNDHAIVTAVPWAETSTLRYGVAKPDDRPETDLDSYEPVFGSSNVVSLADRDFLYVEVKAQNGDTNVYKFRIYVGRVATIKTLMFKTRPPLATEDVDVEALGKGTAKTPWSDNSGAGGFESPHQPDLGFRFTVELDEVYGRWQWAHLTSLPTTNTQPSWSEEIAIGTGVWFEDGDYLAIKVIPPNRQVGSLSDFFYKVKIGLLAAEFTEQPESAVYNVGDPVKALEFKLDQDIPNATYQWWEANSWYGGYGFDAEGRQGETAGVPTHPDWGKNDAGVLKYPYGAGDMEYASAVSHGNDKEVSQLVLDLVDANPNCIPFDVSGWHQIKLDEKKNVSLHNGGNEFYNLPTPGRPIPGATGPTYTPPNTGVNRQPFLANFTNHTHYYWVEVTAPSGLKAVSRRAFVVTEWNQEWNYGASLGDIVDEITGEVYVNTTTRQKQHHIIDLYAYQRKSPGVHYGLQSSPRNITPFKKGNHGDEYIVPLTFPPDFDPLDYSIVTAQALFFLADGRAWIQNWTQGDFGFYAHDYDLKDVHDDSCLVEKVNGVDKADAHDKQVVLWYNITNDNATRGLSSSGNEPSGSGIDVIPTHLVVKPAGTKSVTKMPPFRVDPDTGNFVTDILGRPLPEEDGDAQGWFTPFIEICEIRFEGPTRKTTAALATLSADGNASTTTTELTLSFTFGDPANDAINGFDKDDITLSGVEGVTKGTLTGSNPYTLPISGFTAGGTLTVKVSKPGYLIDDATQTVQIFKAP